MTPPEWCRRKISAPIITCSRWLASDGSLRLWDVARPGHPVLIGAPLLVADRQKPLYAVAFSLDGSLLAAAGAG